MRNKKVLLSSMVAAVAALALGGCGVQGSGGSSSDDASSAGETKDIMAVTDEELQGATVTLARFFGDCNETTDGVTDMEMATTECEAIQILTNIFEADNKWGIKVERMGARHGTPTMTA